ncbi:MAG: SDR family NAD(P)-dependent oxidoreductase [Cyclobacteriaceae bacterium]|nr:SDR family NAD(P)-dependent oxidoreductase [Cyclobacteriaceae bacterium]
MRNILITGVSTGIGLHLTKIFIHRGYRVFGSVRKRCDALPLANEFGDRFHALIFDVTDHAAIHDAFEKVKIMVKNEGLAGLINNAGIAINGTVMHTTIAQYQKQFDVNFFGLIAVTKAFLPLLGAVKNYPLEPGKIINISSVSGKIALPFLSPYCTSKFATEAFSDALRREMLPYGIDVITIGPGPVATPIWKKSSELSVEILESDYGPVIAPFQRHLEKSIKNAMKPDILASKIFDVFVKKKPKTRYTFVYNKFFNYYIPRYLLTPRQLDKIIAKMFRF